MSGHSLTYLSDSPETTCALARDLAARLGPGDVLLLSGDLGTGKTHFARCAIQSRLSRPEDVPSPTYTLVQTYETGQTEIWHADLYRLTDSAELEELGLPQAFEEAICLIEWPDRLGDLAPDTALRVHLRYADTDSAREIRFDWRAPRWSALLQEVAHA